MTFLIQLILSLLLGFVIGLERERHGKMVGTRTLSLIVLGSMVFTTMSPTIFQGDNSRIIAQVVSGIGFIGAGIIFKDGNQIRGLTTAATVWTASAVGCLIGCEMFLEAIYSSITIVIINLFFRYFKQDKDKYSE